MPEIIVLVTSGSEAEALKIARALVEAHLVACANIVPKIQSVFKWEGRLQEEAESLIIMKSQESRMEEIFSKVKELHSYDVPEVIAMPIISGLPDYLGWVSAMTQKK